MIAHPAVLCLLLPFLLFRVLLILVEAPDPLSHCHEPVPLPFPEGQPLLLLLAFVPWLLLGVGLQLLLDVLVDPGLHQLLLGVQGRVVNRGMRSLEDLVSVLDVDDARPHMSSLQKAQLRILASSHLRGQRL